MTCSRLLLATVVFFGCLSSSAQQSQPPTVNGKPLYEQDVLPVVESSLGQMWDSADVVVELSIISNETRGFGPTPFVNTVHTSRALRVLKGSLKSGSSIVFAEAAGQLELPDKIIRAGDHEALAAGNRYVVFLRWWKPFDLWTGDRFHAFKLNDGHVEPQGYGSVADAHRDLSEGRFFNELDRIARTSRPKV